MYYGLVEKLRRTRLVGFACEAHDAACVPAARKGSAGHWMALGWRIEDRYFLPAASETYELARCTSCFSRLESLALQDGLNSGSWSEGNVDGEGCSVKE